MGAENVSHIIFDYIIGGGKKRGLFKRRDPKNLCAVYLSLQLFCRQGFYRHRRHRFLSREGNTYLGHQI